MKGKDDDLRNREKSEIYDDNERKIRDYNMKLSSLINFKINHIIKFNLIVHNSTEEEYNVKVINDIIYNEDKGIVSKFKDHLIYNDPAEFLRRFYSFAESSEIVTQWGSFFDEESLIKLVPNYAIISTKKYLLKNIRKKLKLREKLRKSYNEENDENENYYSKSIKPKYSRFFVSNLDLKDSLHNNSTLDLNFNLIDDADKSRFYSCNNYTILNSNYKNFNKNAEFFNNTKDKENEEEEKNSNKKYYFYDSSARFVIFNEKSEKSRKNNFILNKILTKYENLSNLTDISERNMDNSRSKFFEISNNSSLNLYNITDKENSFNENSNFNNPSIKPIFESSQISNKYDNTGPYQVKYDENTKQHIVKLTDKKGDKLSYNRDDYRSHILGKNQMELKDNKENTQPGVYAKNIRNFDLNNDLKNNINLFNIPFCEGKRIQNLDLYNDIISNDSMNIHEDLEYNSNVIITNYEENNITYQLKRKNDQQIIENENKTFDINLEKSIKNQISNSAKKDNEQINHKGEDKNKMKFSLKKYPGEEENRIIFSNEEKSKEPSKNRYVKQKSLERNSSTKNLFMDTNRKLSIDFNQEKLLEKFNNANTNGERNLRKALNINTNKINKETENNYFNLQTRKSLKKNIEHNINYKPKISFANKNKKNPKLNKNISGGSPNNKNNNLQKDNFSKEKNHNLYSESKIYQEKKQKNLKNLNENIFKKEVLGKEIFKDKIKEKDGNFPSQESPFKLANEFNSINKKKIGTMNRVQSVQDLQNDNLKIDKIFDSKDKKDNVNLYSKSQNKNNYFKKLNNGNNEENSNINRNSSKNLIEKRKPEGKKNIESLSNINENTFAKGYKNLPINGNYSERESKNLYSREKYNDSKGNITKQIGGKGVIKYKSSHKIEREKTQKLNFPEKSNSSSKISKSTNLLKSSQNKPDTNSKKNIQNLLNAKSSTISEKLNENETTQINLNNNLSTINISQGIGKSQKLIGKHKKTYSDFSTPSPINKTKNKFAVAAESLNLQKNFRDAKKSKNKDKSQNRENALTSTMNTNVIKPKNKINDFINIEDFKNIYSERTENRDQFKIFDLNSSVSNQNSNNINSNNYINNLVYLNLNSKEDNTLPRDETDLDLLRNNSNTYYLQSNEKSKLNSFNIPIFESIEMKKKLVKQNSLKNPEINSKFSNNFDNLANCAISFNKNLIFSNNDKSIIPISKFSDIDKTESSISPTKSINNNLLNSVGSNITNNIHNELNNANNIKSAINLENFANYNQLEDDLEINKIESDFNDKFEKNSRNLDNLIRSKDLKSQTNASNTINFNFNLNNSTSMQSVGNSAKKLQNAQISTNSVQNSLNTINFNDLQKNKSYKIIDTVHLNKFLNNRTTNLNMNSLNIKGKTTTIANFVSISNQDNLKLNLNNGNNEVNSVNDSINATNKENTAKPQGDFSEAKDIKENNYDENKEENFKFEKNLNVNMSQKMDHFSIVRDGQGTTILNNMKFYNMNLKASQNQINPVGNLQNVNLNSNNTNNSCNTNNTNNTNNSGNKIRNFNYKNRQEENSTPEGNNKKSESSNFYSKTTKLNENSSIENCLQITGENYSKHSNDASSHNFKNSFNNLGNITNNDNMDMKSNGSKGNILSFNKAKASSNINPYKIENNSSYNENTKNTINSNNSNNKEKTDMVIQKENLINSNYYPNKISSSEINQSNKNSYGKGNCYKNSINGNLQNEQILQNINVNVIGDLKEEKDTLNNKYDRNSVGKVKNASHKKTKSSDFNSSNEKYSNKFINTQKGFYPKSSVNQLNNENLFNSQLRNSNSNVNLLNNKNSNIHNQAVAINPQNLNNVGFSSSSSNFNLMYITKDNIKNNPNEEYNLENQNEKLKKNKVNFINSDTNPPIISKHKKNSYSHAFISFGGKQTNVNNLLGSNQLHQNNQIGNSSNLISGNNIINYKNYNNSNKIKLISQNNNSKEKEKIILNFSSNNSSNLNNNINTKPSDYNQHIGSYSVGNFNNKDKNSLVYKNANLMQTLSFNSKLKTSGNEFNKK